MQRICGVELKGNEAIIVLMAMDRGLCQVPDCRVRKVVLASDDPKGLKHFQKTFAKLMSDYQITDVVIKQRATKGKFAGGAVGFKLEACIQLIDELTVSLLHSSAIGQTLKRHPLAVSLADAGLKGFQDGAFQTAYAALMGSAEPDSVS
ncbi:DUF3010 family protein [Aestuariibacter halophilus]|uniref:DUF3010 family protein n=1 Tax=Fluctibacter halophilus TaxID=226011 RepID=A0ABS8G9R9_9ALTE|nr:DUF3010 family protein [Aestuariibacter halophilus]MCC2616560.1 DUF3010 family protein [Aestuariibacter halophilus]